jgi:hypothetical protein
VPVVVVRILAVVGLFHEEEEAVQLCLVQIQILRGTAEHISRLRTVITAVEADEQSGC